MMRTLRRIWRHFFVGTALAADPSCPDCYGNGYDASGQACRCLRPIHENRTEEDR